MSERKPKCCSPSNQKGKYQQKELKYYSENEPLHINIIKKRGLETIIDDRTLDLQT